MPEKSLADKSGLILGVANKNSIAWAIARELAHAGARLAFTYQGDRLKSKVESLIADLPNETLLFPCDVTVEHEIRTLFAGIEKSWGGLDFIVHSIAFAQREDLEGHFVNTSRSGYLLAQEISSYSLTALAREAAPLMSSGGSIVTMSYLGGERVVQGYNVMGVAKAALEASMRYLANDLGPRGIRVNAISAGPINTLAARGISGFRKILDIVEEKAPLRRNVELSEVAGAALFLVSPLSSGITGEVLHVDSGYHILGM